MIRAAILTVSDSCSEGTRDDLSGPAIKEILEANEFEVCQTEIVPDDHDAIINELEYFADELAVDIVLTTGGTGLGPRDITPEATKAVCQRMVPGLAETMRAEGLKKTPNAILSRSAAGVRGDTLIINLPGSQKAVRQCLDVILPVLSHAVKMMQGGGH